MFIKKGFKNDSKVFENLRSDRYLLSIYIYKLQVNHHQEPNSIAQMQFDKYAPRHVTFGERRQNTHTFICMYLFTYKIHSTVLCRVKVLTMY
jgi:hypothetical protein